MKRKLWIILALTALIGLLWYGTALADESGSCGENLTWTLTDGGTLTISGSGAMTDYSDISEVPWYASRASVKFLSIGSGVTSIGKYAFYGCTSLTEVTLPDSVTVIGNYAFYGCTGLTSVTIPNSVTSIGNSAFRSCTGLTSVTIPNSVTNIKYLAFKNCSNLAEATILNSSATIGDSDHDVFKECAAGFTLWGWAGSTAQSYATAANHAFMPLNSGACGDSLTYSFDPGTGKLTISGSGAMADYFGASRTPWFLYRESILSVVIENGATTISRYAFDGCTGLSSVTIPSSVTTVGYRAFRNCSRLTGVTISNPDCVIGDSDYDVFDGCSSGLKITGWSGSTAETYAAAANLTFESLGSTSGQFGDSVYYTVNPHTGTVSITGTGPMWDFSPSFASPLYGNTALNSVTIGSGVTSIGERAFESCSNLTSVTIPNSVTSIGNSAFRSCTGLTSVTIPNSVDSIGSYAFRSCTGLTSIAVEAGNSAYSADGGVLFDKSKKTLICYPAGKTGSYTIPNSVTSIGNSAFYYCTGLTSVTIPNSVDSIGNFAFYSCTGLTSVTIPNSVNRIGTYAFYYCTGLTSVTIPNSVGSIGSYAFYYCTGLKDVSVHNAEAVFGSNAFSVCTLNLHGHSGSTAETYAAGNSSITFVALTAEMGTPDFVLPAYLTAIEAEAFSGVKATVVYIPDGVTSLGSMAFAYCTSLKQIRIPASVTVIFLDVFYGLSSSQLHAITVFGTPGSAAETYANSKGMKFEVE